MANIASAKKRARQSTRRRLQNASFRSMLRTYLNRVTEAIATGDKAKAVTACGETAQMIDKIASKGVIHKNKAARHKSHLNARVKAMG